MRILLCLSAVFVATLTVSTALRPKIMRGARNIAEVVR